MQIEWNAERSAATVTRESDLTGELHERVIAPLRPEWVQAWQDGALIQNAMPLVSEEGREFLLTGITPEEWEDLPPEEPHCDVESGGVCQEGY